MRRTKKLHNGVIKWKSVIGGLSIYTICNTLQHTATHCNTLQHDQTLWEPTCKGRIGAKRRSSSGGRSAPKGWCEGQRRCSPSCSPKTPACCSRPAKAKAPTCACIYALCLIRMVCCSLLQCVLQPQSPHLCIHIRAMAHSLCVMQSVAVCVAALKPPPVAAVQLKPKPPPVHSYARYVSFTWCVAVCCSVCCSPKAPTCAFICAQCLIHRVCCSLLQCVLQPHSPRLLQLPAAVLKWRMQLQKWSCRLLLQLLLPVLQLDE